MSAIYIAGAHSRAQTLGYYLKYLNPETQILAYLYDDDENNPLSIDGVPVIKINTNSVLNAECSAYIGTRGANFENISNTLRACGIRKIIMADVKFDIEIRNRFLKRYYESIGKEYRKITDECFNCCKSDKDDKKVAIYVVQSAFDKPLQYPYHLKKEERLIQVGASLAKGDWQMDYADNIGDNISEKNSQFCELTGLYWIWKNAQEDAVGLEHYRRHFILPDDWINRMVENDIDVILPTPLCVRPNIEDNFRNRHLGLIWDAMLECVKEDRPDEYNELACFFAETGIYSPCNMFIMKKEVLNKLCKWMFPILFAVNEKIGEIEDKYQNRYPGFLSERLISFYFEKHNDEYNVVYSDKSFLS